MWRVGPPRQNFSIDQSTPIRVNRRFVCVALLMGTDADEVIIDEEVGEGEGAAAGDAAGDAADDAFDAVEPTREFSSC